MESPELSNRRNQVGRVASLGQPDGETSARAALVSLSGFGLSADLLHDLSQVLASVLTNAQVLDGKLPSYSRSKRYIHEIERSAQRGRVLLGRVLKQLPKDGHGGAPDERDASLAQVPPVDGSMAVVANQGPIAAAGELDEVSPSVSALAAPAFCCAVSAAHRNV